MHRSYLLIGAAAAAMSWYGHAKADPYVVTSTAPSPTAGYTMGGYMFSSGGGILVQLTDGAGNFVSASHPLPIGGSFSASIGGFTPNGTFAAPMVINGTSSEITLPAGSVELITNVGTSTAYVNFGTSAAITATTSATPIAPGGAFPVTLGSYTTMAAISSGTTTLNVSGGAGLFTGLSGIGAGGGGGGGTVTQGPGGTNTSPWYVTPGTSTFPITGSLTGTSTFALGGTGTVIVGGPSIPPLSGTSTVVLNSSPTVTQGAQGTNTSPWYVSPGTSTFPVSGTVTAIPGAGTSTVVATGTVTATEPNVNGTSGQVTTQIVGIQSLGGTGLTTGQIACGTTATVIAAARTNRQTITIENLGTGTIYLGGTAVTTAGGMLLPPLVGASVTWPTTQGIDCIATATSTVSYDEIY